MSRARTNIELESTHVAAIMRRYGLSTKTEAVNLALRKLAGEAAMTRDEALAMEGSNSMARISTVVPLKLDPASHPPA